MSITIIICEVETMKDPLVITMAREYASGGSEIAQKVADLLGIPLYNKELITIAAKKSGLTEEAIAASETQRSGSLIYSLYMMGNTMPLADQVYILQSNVIKELAAKGPCVILGRCGDYVLRERKDVLRVFIYAPVEWRRELAKTDPLVKAHDEKGIKEEIEKTDRNRAAYYNYYTQNRWPTPKCAPMPRICPIAYGRPIWPSMTAPVQATTTITPRTAGARPRTTICA